jgi:biotin synthase
VARRLTSSELQTLLARAATSPRALDEDDLAALLAIPSDDEEALQALYAAACAVKHRHCGRTVAMRGLVEAGNICSKDCLYCGIRRSNPTVERYQLDAAEIERLARLAADQGYASLVIQSGEIESEPHTAFIEDILRRIAPLDLGVTLSLGEQTEETYRRWRAAGATRYLLRIETSSPALYAKLHPPTHSWQRRADCLRALRRCGYQVGTGVMCALPGQTPHDLARDIQFFADLDIDMLGMGPYIPHPDTPLAAEAATSGWNPVEALTLGLKLIAVARLHLHDVNIAAATALQALAPDGRERGILAGANVLMPNITDTRYRRSYQLYAGKPCLDENAALCRTCLESRLHSIGAPPAWHLRQDSPHFHARTASPSP